jgi:[ribosomal protein S5]-alanine N-acetyltransferase
MNKDLKELKICGKQIHLRPFQDSDITNHYVAWLNDNEVVKYSNQRFSTHTIETSKKYLDSFLNTDNIYMAIEDLSTKELYGSITAYIESNHGTADIGILVGHKKSWGKGIGSEAWKLMMDFLLTQGGIRKVTGGTMSCNLGMIKIMKKNSMIHEATKKNHQLLDGEPVDIVYFYKFSDRY